MRRSYVQDPETGRLVPKEEYQRAGAVSHYIQGDIDPFISPIDKTVISSRSQLAAHHKRHGTTDARDYPPEYVAKRAKARIAAQQRADKEDRINTLRRAFERQQQ